MAEPTSQAIGRGDEVERGSFWLLASGQDLGMRLVGGGDCYCCLLFAGGRPSSLPGEENRGLPDKHQRELDYENFFICTSITVTSL